MPSRLSLSQVSRSRLTFVFSILLSICLLPGCQQYGEVSSQSYEFAKALYSVCNRKDEARLTTTETAIEAAVEKKELPANEAEDLKAIIEKAREGQWAAAMQDCRTMMTEQNVQT